MLDESNFKEKAIKKAKEYFEGVHLTEEQHKIYIELFEIIHQFIPIDSEALKGMIWASISMWQKDYNSDIITIAIKSHEERMKILTQISDYLRIELIENLINSKYEGQVTKGVDEMLAHYDEKYANI